MTSSPGSSMLHTAGIVGTRLDGSIATGVDEQAAEVWKTIGVLLDSAGFDPSDIVSYTTYVVAGEDLAGVMDARDAFMDGHRAASTLITVPALAQPQWKVEVAVIAARAD
jgi:2-iminobutanoate/2-iminopropanoate deaminase